MAVGWCIGPNATLLLDGQTVLPVLAGIGATPPNSDAPERIFGQYGALMAVVPAGIKPNEPHTIAAVTTSGVVSNALRLNAPDVWWAQGDDGPNATSGGWLRVFGRDLGGETAASARTTVPLALQAALDRLSASWDPRTQLNALSALRDDLLRENGTIDSLVATLAPPPVATTTLTLSLLSADVDTDKTAEYLIPADPATLGRYAATFHLPTNLPAGEYNVTIETVAGSKTGIDFFETPKRSRVRTIVVEPASLPRPTIWVEGPAGLNISADPAVPYGTVGSGLPIDVTVAFQSALARASAIPGGATVRLRAGQFHINGPIRVANGVTIAGAGADLTAIYFAMDNETTGKQFVQANNDSPRGFNVHHLKHVACSLLFALKLARSST